MIHQDVISNEAKLSIIHHLPMLELLMLLRTRYPAHLPQNARDFSSCTFFLFTF